MKKVINTASAIVLASSLIVSVGYAADHTAPIKSHNMVKMHDVKSIQHQFKSLNLTSDQQNKIDSIINAAKEQSAPLIQEMKKAQQALQQLTKNQQNYSDSEVKKLAQRQGKIISRLIYLRADSMHKVNMILTDTQKQQLQAMREQSQQAKRG